MNRTPALIVSVAVALVAVTGAYALSDTLAMGKQTSSTTDNEVAERSAQLERFEASLRKALEEQPPALPAVPNVSTGGASNQVAAVTPPRAVYHRPAPTAVTDESAGDDHESESEDREHEGEEHEDTEDEDGRHEGDDDDD